MDCRDHPTTCFGDAIIQSMAFSQMKGKAQFNTSSAIKTDSGRYATIEVKFDVHFDPRCLITSQPLGTPKAGFTSPIDLNTALVSPRMALLLRDQRRRSELRLGSLIIESKSGDGGVVRISLMTGRRINQIVLTEVDDHGCVSMRCPHVSISFSELLEILWESSTNAKSNWSPKSISEVN